VSSCIFLGRVGVFTGGLEAVGGISKNGIRSGPLLGSVGFGFVHWYSAYIRHHCSVVLFYRSLFVLCGDLVFIIYLPFKKKKGGSDRGV
jgi:hypothetical protein